MRRLLCIGLVACATLGGDGQGDVDLPRTGVGPFRKLEPKEVPGVAPYVLDNQNARYRQPAALALPDGSVALYVVAVDAGQDVIVRTRAQDQRAFYGAVGDFGHRPPVVLRPDLPWEGTALAKPSVVRFGERLFLYYRAAGGIGLARSDDGFRFTKEPSPVFARDAAVPWEKGEVDAVSAAVLEGEVHLFYATGGALGEAVSADGVHFTRVDADPATAALDPVLTAGPAGGFDAFGVFEPCVSPRLTPTGRLQVRVLYTGYDKDPASGGKSVIAFAGRYGVRGTLARNPLPVYAVGAGEHAPALWGSEAYDMLYVEQSKGYPAIAAAVAPVKQRFTQPQTFAPDP
jgi:hypothetical protein